MPGEFKADVFQNQYLPAGATEVHAIMTVSAQEATGATGATGANNPAGRLFGILCDVSGSMEGGKIVAARESIIRLIQLLPNDCAFFIVTGNTDGHLVFPASQATAMAKETAIAAVRKIRADGGTMISEWLKMALQQFRGMPGGIRQAVLLTDGQNDETDAAKLNEMLQMCEGAFQCDCRGVGTDWVVGQLRQISAKLLGTTDLIASPGQIEADFRAILEKALGKSVSDVFLRLWTPQGANVKFCKQVSPEIVDLTGRERVPKPQIREYPTGAWGKSESRDFHFCIEVKPGAVGDEVLAGRASLVYWKAGVENKAAEARILAVWTDDEAKSTKIDRVVAHYTGQADLAQSIQEGLDAKGRGDADAATVLLGKAVRIAHESGNEATAKLLRGIVDVQDAEKGTVRLKKQVSKEEEMALETRSTKTARIGKP